MSILTLSTWLPPVETTAPTEGPPKPDWPLMGDVASFRAGVPEALIHWRRAKGEAVPRPCDPDLL
ncbi:MAG: hypothetical protein AAF222_00925 [Pseudomonadota bacterium]